MGCSPAGYSLLSGGDSVFCGFFSGGLSFGVVGSCSSVLLGGSLIVAFSFHEVRVCIWVFPLVVVLELRRAVVGCRSSDTDPPVLVMVLMYFPFVIVEIQ